MVETKQSQGKQKLGRKAQERRESIQTTNRLGQGMTHFLVQKILENDTHGRFSWFEEGKG